MKQLSGWVGLLLGLVLLLRGAAATPQGGVNEYVYLPLIARLILTVPSLNLTLNSGSYLGGGGVWMR